MEIQHKCPQIQRLHAQQHVADAKKKRAFDLKLSGAGGVSGGLGYEAQRDESVWWGARRRWGAVRKMPAAVGSDGQRERRWGARGRERRDGEREKERDASEWLSGSGVLASEGNMGNSEKFCT